MRALLAVFLLACGASQPGPTFEEACADACAPTPILGTGDAVVCQCREAFPSVYMTPKGHGMAECREECEDLGGMRGWSRLVDACLCE